MGKPHKKDVLLPKAQSFDFNESIHPKIHSWLFFSNVNGLEQLWTLNLATKDTLFKLLNYIIVLLHEIANCVLQDSNITLHRHLKKMRNPA